MEQATMATSFSSPPSTSRLFSPRSKSPSASTEKPGIKPVENPFLIRGAPVARTNKTEGTSSNPASPTFAPRSPSVLAAVPANELRNRKGAPKAKVEPPKTSVYLRTGGDFGGTNGITSNENEGSYDFRMTSTSSASDGCWILIYGYTNYRQYQALVEKFGECGRILKRKKPSSLFSDKNDSHQNWVALQYESRLEAEKAICHDHFQLESGVFCGVKRLSNDDPILLYQGVQEDSRDTAESALIPIDGSDDDGATTGPVDEGARVQSVCERFFRWALSIH